MADIEDLIATVNVDVTEATEKLNRLKALLDEVNAVIDSINKIEIKVVSEL